jgi:glycosyltransferase involved in cell wall biosynthesis
MLQRLLGNLATQDTGGQFEFSVVIIDNDAAGSARETVSCLASEVRLDVTYALGEVNTIPVARNRALGLARGNFIGIIDDDEFPPPDWLLTMYRAIQTFGVDGALGPVKPFFDDHPPDWLIRGRFCDRPIHQTGTLLKWDQTRTGNVLLKREVFEKHGLSFDESFTTGGSDREFFKQAMSRGCRFVAVEEAPVYEVVPPERQTRSYWVKRAMVNGFNSHKNTIDQMNGLTRAILPVKLLGATLLYAIATPFCACLGRHVLVQCLERGTHHMSSLCAMLGIELVKKRNF